MFIVERESRRETHDTAWKMVVTFFRYPKLYEKCLYLTSTQVAARFAKQLRVLRVSVVMVLRELEYSQVKNHYDRFGEVVEIQMNDIGKSVPKDNPDESNLPF